VPPSSPVVGHLYQTGLNLSVAYSALFALLGGHATGKDEGRHTSFTNGGTGAASGACYPRWAL